MADNNATAQFNTISASLDRIGLGELFTVDGAGNPSGWLWNQIQAGVDTEDEIMAAIRSTDTFKDRFSVITAQEKAVKEGGAGYVMSPQDVLNYEREVKEYMAAAGLPASFYDQPSDFHKLILSDLSPAEVNNKITAAYDYVLSAPPEVRESFEEFYGVGQGDAQLAAWALDPERTVRDINKATRTAYAAGMSERFDIKINRATAERIADLPMTEGGITEGLKQVASLKTVFREGLGETNDITSNDGVASVFEGDADAQTAIDRRLTQRSAIRSRSTGGALSTREGVVGVGTS